MSPRYQGFPVPSTTRAWRMRRSKSAAEQATAASQRNKGRKRMDTYYFNGLSQSLPTRGLSLKIYLTQSKFRHNLSIVTQITRPEIEDSFRRAGLRCTPQRFGVMEFLIRRPVHATAD